MRRETELDRAVKKAEYALAALLLERISREIRRRWPQARVLHCQWSDYEHRSVIGKILGIGSSVLHDENQHSRLGAWKQEAVWVEEERRFLFDAERLARDIDQYIVLAPPSKIRLLAMRFSSQDVAFTLAPVGRC